MSTSPLVATSTGSTTRWGRRPSAGEFADAPHGARLGEHARFGGEHVEIVHDGAHLGFDHVGIDVRDGAHPEGVLCGHGGQGRRRKDAKGVH